MLEGLRRYARPTLDERFWQPAESRCVDLESMGKVLRQRRRELGWTQAEAAAICMTNQRMVSNIERGARGVAFDTVCRYADALRVDVVARIRGR